MIITADPIALIPDAHAAYVRFGTLLFLAFIIGFTPSKYPFKWLETYYHELSHGLAALLTGGRIGRIRLYFHGGGYCTFGGGFMLFILFMGYAGAALWGGYLYLAGWYIDHTGAISLLTIELLLLCVITLLYVRDPVTLLISLCMGALFAYPIFNSQAQGLPVLIQFTGLYVLLNAIRAPLALIDGQHVGDGALLQDKTWIHEYVWIIAWLAFTLYVLAFIMAKTLPGAATLFAFLPLIP